MGVRAAGLTPRGTRPLRLVLILALVGAAGYTAIREGIDPGLGLRGGGDVPEGIPAQAQAGVVEKIVDGDTLWVRIDEPGGPLLANATHKIRLLEIDTPETVAPGRPIDCGGPQASAFAARRMPVGSRVFLLADREDVDRYGRFLRYVWTEDGDFFNLDAVRTGHARAVLFAPNDAYIEIMRAAEQRARSERLGVWGAYCPSG